MDNASTAIPRTHYPYPPIEIIEQLCRMVENSHAISVISSLSIQWTPTRVQFDKLVKIAKQSKDAIKTIRYLPEDSRTPDVFMSHNGPTIVAFSKLLDTIKTEEPKYPVDTFDNLSRSYMLPGIEVSDCEVCDRVVLHPDISGIHTSKELADIYDLELKQKANLCSFCFICLCLEIELKYPRINEIVQAPTLPDGRPVIWIGDPGWSKHSEEYRKLSLQYQGNF